jgi:LPXTG-motif cell wall-anchored protein
LKKLMLLAAMMAMGLLVAVPAIAQNEQDNEQEADSGEVDQSFTVTGGGSNGSSCTPLQGNAQTGNSQDQIDIDQDSSTVDDFEFEESGSNITSSGNSSTECKQEVNQAASAAAPKATPPPPPAPKAAPAPAPAPKVASAPAPAPKVAPAPAPKVEAQKAEAKKAELPKTGGMGTASLFALGTGGLLVAGGLLARRIFR